MKLHCEVMSKLIIPAIRALVAMRLIRKYKMTQIEAAKKLGVTQPAISYYLHSKRGKIAIEKIRSNKDIMKCVEKLTDVIYREESSDEVQKIMCEICAIIKREKATYYEI